MATATLNDEAFLAILKAHPGLRDRFVSIAMAVVDSDGNLKEADAIEERIVEEMRLLGRAAMQGWSENQVAATEQEIRQHPQMHRQGKKNSTGIRNSAKSKF
jgi:membrane-bound ClpP family serine protease